MNHKPRSRVVLEELRKEISTQASSTSKVQENTSQVDNISLHNHSGRIIDTSADDDPKSDSEAAQHVVVDIQSQRMSYHNGRVIRQLDRYMFLKESFDNVPDGQDTDPCNYNEAIEDKDAEF